MPIPPDLAFDNEDDFVQRFLVPLLTRLGFQIPVNYHGKQELGKDLVFSEIDRFSNVVYHGLQAKYEDSIGQAVAADLIDDCVQAFTVPFTLPTTGVSHRITTFLLVNAGSIPDNTRLLFQKGTERFGGGVRLLDGKGLLALDRHVASTRLEFVLERLLGLQMEIKHNRIIFDRTETMLKSVLAGEIPLVQMSPFRLSAFDRYLSSPISSKQIDLDTVNDYWVLTSSIQRFNDALLTLRDKANRKDGCAKFIDYLNHAVVLGEQIITQVDMAVNEISPLRAK